MQVVDPTIKVGEFEDLSKVEKFEISEEEYAKKSGTNALETFLTLNRSFRIKINFQIAYFLENMFV